MPLGESSRVGRRRRWRQTYALWVRVVVWFWRCFLAGVHGARVRRRWLVPQRGPVILVGNHQSFYDGQLVGGFAGRMIYFLVSAPYLRMPVIGPFLLAVGCIPIGKTGGSEAQRASIAVLENDCALGVFPEAHRTRDGDMLPWKPGAFRLALTHGVPVQPVSILGAHEVWPAGRLLPRLRRPIVLAYHRPIPCERAPRAELKERAAELDRRVRRVLERRVAAWQRLRRRQAKRA